MNLLWLILEWLLYRQNLAVIVFSVILLLTGLAIQNHQQQQKLQQEQLQQQRIIKQFKHTVQQAKQLPRYQQRQAYFKQQDHKNPIVLINQLAQQYQLSLQSILPTENNQQIELKSMGPEYDTRQFIHSLASYNFYYQTLKLKRIDENQVELQLTVNTKSAIMQP